MYIYTHTYEIHMSKFNVVTTASIEILEFSKWCVNLLLLYIFINALSIKMG